MSERKVSLRGFLNRCRKDDGRRRMLESMFGTSDPPEIVASVGAEVVAYTGEGVRAWQSLQLSNGLAAAMTLRSGEQMFVKFHRPGVESAYLHRVRALQEKAFAAGFPCAEPLSGLIPFRKSHVAFDSFLAPPSSSRVRNQVTRAALAKGLCEFGEFLTTCSPMSQWGKAATPKSLPLWPPTDHPRYIQVIQQSHPWLDDVAASALQLLAGKGHRRVVCHMDWRMENVRVWGARINAIYDWDAIFAVDECNAAGTAAILHTINWADGAGAASPAAALAFLQSYERARFAKFSVAERAACVAYGLYAICVVAKHNYASDPDEKHWKGSARQYVHRNGARLLELARTGGW